MMGEMQAAIYKTALDAERKMHEDCNADLNRAIDTLAERDAEIERLRAQVAELQAWKDAVPVWALQLTHDRGSHIDTDEFESAWDVVHAWLFPDGDSYDDNAEDWHGRTGHDVM